MGIDKTISVILDNFEADIVLWSSLATIILVLVLIWQVAEMRSQTKLAYNPLITIRFTRNYHVDRIPQVMIENVGHGTAVDIDIKLTNADTNVGLYNYKAFAIKKDEFYVTEISFNENPRVRAKGSYTNIRKNKIKIDKIFDFEKLSEQITQDNE